MTNRTKIIIGIIVVIVIVGMIFRTVKNRNMETNVAQNQDEISNMFDYLNETDEDNKINNVIENNVVEENLLSNTEINDVDSAQSNSVVGKEEQESSDENTEVDNREIAIELAQKEWAISVDSYDFEPELQSDGTYLVRVRNKTDRNEVTRYTVDVKTGAVVEAE